MKNTIKLITIPSYFPGNKKNILHYSFNYYSANETEYAATSMCD